MSNRNMDEYCSITHFEELFFVSFFPLPVLFVVLAFFADYENHAVLTIEWGTRSKINPTCGSTDFVWSSLE
jgi:hypothetical protein